MVNVLDYFENRGLFNTDCDLIVYFDKTKHEFIVLDAWDSVDSDNLITTPYKNSFSKNVWKHFYMHLTKEEHDLIMEFDEYHGFFDFLHTSGLYSKYEASYRFVAEHVLNEWQMEHGISINVT